MAATLNHLQLTALANLIERLQDAECEHAVQFNMPLSVEFEREDGQRNQPTVILERDNGAIVLRSVV